MALRLRRFLGCENDKFPDAKNYAILKTQCKYLIDFFNFEKNQKCEQRPLSDSTQNDLYESTLNIFGVLASHWIKYTT